MPSLKQRLAALEATDPASGWGRVLDGLPDADLERLEQSLRS